jgi:hypothetical protein
MWRLSLAIFPGVSESRTSSLREAPANFTALRTFQWRMAGTVIVGVYDSRTDAQAARARLIEHGIPEERIQIAQRTDDASERAQQRGEQRNVDEPLPEDRGVSGFISRMFSGALMEDTDIEKYSHAMRSGRCVVAVQTRDDDETNAATTIFTGASIRTYSLPNAPSGWREAPAGARPSIGDYVDRDPARPEGLMEDAAGLSADADRALRKPRAGSGT